MKTSIAKKLRDRVLAAFLAIAVMLSCVVPSAITASASDTDTPPFDFSGMQQIEGDDYGVEFSDLNIQIPDPNDKTKYKDLENGDVISKNTKFSLHFKWKFGVGSRESEMVQGGFPVVMHFDLSDKMQNLQLAKGQSGLVNGENGTKMQYYYDGTDLWIVIVDSNGMESGFYGSGDLEADLSMDNEADSNNEEATVQFFDKQMNVVIEENSPTFSVAKSAGNVTFDEATGKFYQEFTITVTAPKAANDVHLKDVYNYGWTLYEAGGLHDLKVDGKSVEANITDEGYGTVTGDIPLGNMTEGQSIDVTYSIEIDPTKEGNGAQNTAEVSSEDVRRPGTGSASTSYMLPSISKSGSVSADRKTVEWTISYKPNSADDIVNTDGDFEIKDTPGDGLELTPDLIEALKAAGASYNDGVITIPSDKMKMVADESYTFTYTTAVTAEYQEQLFDTTVENDIDLKYKDEHLKVLDKSAKGQTVIKGIEDSSIEKTLEKNTATDRFYWSSKVHFADAEITSVKFTDRVTNGTGYQNQKIDKDSVKITYKKDGADVTKTLSEVSSDAVLNSDGSELNFSFTADFLSELGDVKDIVITYETIPVDAAGTASVIDESLALQNYIEFETYYKDIETSIKKNSTYSKKSKGSGEKVEGDGGYADEVKRYVDTYEQGFFPKRWSVTLNGTDSFVPEKNSVITIVDTLPEGCTIIKDSWTISVGDNRYYVNWWSTDNSNISVSYDEPLSNGQKVARIEIKINDALYENLINDHESWGTSPRTDWALTFYYGTEITKADLSDLYENHREDPNHWLTLTNTADIYYGEDKIVGDKTASTNIELNYDNELDKYTLDAVKEKAGTSSRDNYEEAAIFSDGDRNYVLYKLIINKEGLYLGGADSDGNAKIPTLKAVDKLGDNLEFGGVVSGYEGEPKRDGQTITFELKNGVPYEIVYKAYITFVESNSGLSDAEAKNKFNNTVTLEGSTTGGLSKDSMISVSVYESRFTGGATTQEATVEINGTKIWQNDNKDKRPNSITVNVVKKSYDKDGHLTKVYDPTPYVYDKDSKGPGFTIDGDKWSFKITGLVSKDKDGNTYTYDITEVTVDGYTTTYDGEHTDIGNESGKKTVDLTITNDGGLTNIDVKKVWEDSEKYEAYGVEKKPVTVFLTVNGVKTERSIELNEDNNWTGTFEDLQIKDGEETINYSVVEENVPEHFKADIKKAGNTVTVTNSIDYTSFNTEVTINKVWVGDNDTNRPTAITVDVIGSDGTSRKCNMTGTGDKWTLTVGDLPKYDSMGEEITYSVTEANVDHYTSVVKPEGNGIFTVTNTYVTEYTSITINKVWDGGSKDPNRPKSVTVTITGKDSEGNECYNKKYEIKADGWTLTVDDLPKYDSMGEEITYSVTETNVDHYTSNVENEGNGIFTVTNTYVVDKTNIKVNKAWGANIESYGLNKQEVTVKLYQNGEEYGTLTLNENNEWTGSFTDLPKTDKEGNAFEYKVEEVSIAGFNSTVNTDEDGNVTITNNPIYSEHTISISGVKTWADFDNNFGKRPQSVTIELYANNVKVRTCNTDEAHGWKYSFDDLDELDPLTGKPIVYTVKEADVECYTPTYTETDDGYDIINTLDTAILKVDEEGKPLAGAVLQIYKDGKAYGESWTTDGTPHFVKLEAGEYVLSEVQPPKGYAVAKEITFTVNEDGSVTQVVMKDDVTKVQISKQDMTTGKEVKGAKLKVVDKDNNVIKEWTSTGEPEYFEKVFKAGESYTLIEETAPDGYVKAEAVEFTVNADGSVTQVVMKDDVTKVSISKKDITGDGELAGAKLQVLDKNGKVIDEWVSTDKPHEINGKLVAGETYTLHEEVAPDGYVVANDIKFVVNADGTITKVTMIDEAKSGTDLDNDTNDRDSGVAQGGGTNDNSPKTGDSSNITLVMLALALGVMTLTKKKRRNI